MENQQKNGGLNFEMKSFMMLWGEARGFIKFMSEDDFYRIVYKYCELWDAVQGQSAGNKKKEFLLQYDDKVIKSEIGGEYFNELSEYVQWLPCDREI